MGSRIGMGTRWTVARDALFVVATGIALGVGFNALERGTTPARGLPWVTRATVLEPVEAVLAPAPARASAPLAKAFAPVRSGTRVTRVEPAASARETVATAAAAGLLSNDPPLRTGGFSPDPPVIPDVGRPLRVELSTVSLLQGANAALVVDAREPEAYTQGHITGAVSLPYDDAMREPARIAALDVRGRPIIVYCSGGTCESSRYLAELMVRDHGLRRVLVYEGGYPEWVAAGKPVEQGRP
ncbi:MAG: rhodanese-like domain-containing protein [Candidatus Eisenbacteria bacterium]